MKRILCRLGIHWPVSVDKTLFVDIVNGQEVFEGQCGCGKMWMHQSVLGMPFFKVPSSGHTAKAKKKA